MIAMRLSVGVVLCTAFLCPTEWIWVLRSVRLCPVMILMVVPAGSSVPGAAVSLW